MDWGFQHLLCGTSKNPESKENIVEIKTNKNTTKGPTKQKIPTRSERLKVHHLYT